MKTNHLKGFVVYGVTFKDNINISIKRGNVMSKFSKNIKPGKYEVRVLENGDITYYFVSNNLITFYYKNENYYREKDLPAIEYPEGSLIWYKDGYIGREGGMPPIYDANNGNPYYEWWDFDKIKEEYATIRKIYLRDIRGFLLIGKPVETERV